MEQNLSIAAFVADDLNNAVYATSGVKGLPAQVESAKRFDRNTTADVWNFYLNGFLRLNLSFTATNGNTFQHLKVYRIKDDGKLQRFKTYVAADLKNNGIVGPITDGFVVGKYIAVATLKNSAGTVVQFRSEEFNFINQALTIDGAAAILNDWTYENTFVHYVKYIGQSANNNYVFNFIRKDNNAVVEKVQVNPITGNMWSDTWSKQFGYIR